MENLTLKQLRYFEAVAAQRHFGRAADICAISQPAISVQIRELEKAVGTSLFERGPREVRLTAFGEVFQAKARAILQAIDDLSDLSRASDGQFVGRLRLGVIPTVAPYFLPSVLAQLAADFPDLVPHIRETQTDSLVSDVIAGRLDMALLALPVSEPDLFETALFDEDFVLVRRKGEQDLPVPDAAGLRKLRLLLLEEGHCFRDQALAFCGMRGSLPADGMEGSSLATLVQMVGSGIGVTLIPEMAVDIESRAANVCVQRFADPTPSRKIGLVWRKNSPLAHHFTRISAALAGILAAKSH